MKKFTKFTAALLSGILTFGALTAVPMTAGAAEAENQVSASSIKLNSDNVTIYALDSTYEEYISIPDDIPQSFKFEVSGTDSSVKWSVVDGDSVTVSSDGEVTPVYETWYWNGSMGTSWSTGAEGETVTQEALCGESTIQAVVDGVTLTATVTVEDYAEYYAEQVINEYIENNITDSMTDMEKLVKICEFVTSYDYSASASGYVSMIVKGGGDCWASTRCVNHMCELVGLKANQRYAAYGGAGSGHMNSAVLADGKVYEVDAGYDEKAPRYYKISELENGITFTYDDGVYYAIQYDGFDTSVTIPETHNGKPVTGIGKAADTFRIFYFSESWNDIYVTDVYLPASISSIDTGALFTESLENIHIAQDSEYFKNDGAAVLTKDGKTLVIYPTNADDDDGVYEIPNGVTEIEDKAFVNNNTLNKVIIPTGTVKIGKSAFRVSYIQNIILPDTLEEIGDYAFYHCDKLDRIFIPKSVTSIGSNIVSSNTEIIGYSGSAAETYANENNLTFISVESILSEGDYSYILLDDGTAELFSYNGSETNVTIPSEIGGKTVSSIDDDCFFDKKDIKSVTIPQSIKTIGEKALGYYYSDDVIEKAETSGVYNYHKKEKVDGFTIYGYTDSAAETYAKENGFTFISLDKQTEPTQATTKATQATTKATQATTKATQATTKATQSTTKATQSTTEPTEATTKATQATTKATQATTKATQATTKATQATTKATQATTKATEPTEAAVEYSLTGNLVTAAQTWAWNVNGYANMTDADSDGVYTASVKVTKAGTYSVTVTEDSEWIDNLDYLHITVSNPCTVKFTFDSTTNTLSIVETDDVKIKTEIDYDSISVVGNGMGGFLNDVYWNAADTTNRMTKTSDKGHGVYEISYSNVESDDCYYFKFHTENNWIDQWGAAGDGSDTVTVKNGVATAVVKNNNTGNLKLDTTDVADYDEPVDITIVLDLSKFDETTGEGGTVTVTVTAANAATTASATTASATAKPAATTAATASTTKSVTTAPATTEPAATTVPVTTKPAATKPVTTAPTTTKPVSTTSAATKPATTAAATTKPAATGTYNNLTVTSTSNFFGASTAVYNKDTKQVCVTYTLDSSMTVENFQGIITYDPTVLSVAADYDDTDDIYNYFPDLNADSIIINPKNSGYIIFNGSDLTHGGFDFTGGKIFITVVFDIINPTDGETTVDLEMQTLTCADYNDYGSAVGNEIILVKNSEVNTDTYGEVINSAVSSSTDDVTSETTQTTPATTVSDAPAENTTAPSSATKATESSKTNSITPTESVTKPTEEPTTEPAETYTLGDVNEDGTVDISDATAVQKAVAKITELTDSQKLAANVNGDTVVDISDATMIQKYVAKIITEFTA